MTVQYKLFLIALAIIGSVLILLLTNRFGAQISPDSVVYLSAARNIAAGDGVSYFGSVVVHHAPLFPAVVAGIGKITGQDPIAFTHIVNAILFGFIIFLGGLFAFQNLPSYPALSILATLSIVFSIPIICVSVFAWSEPLFISFFLLSLIFAHRYATEGKISHLILFAISVAFSTLTRYIGIVLIVWGLFAILAKYRTNIKGKISHLFIFILISAVPITLWTIRNYYYSGTFFGNRTSSEYTLSQNIVFVFGYTTTWFIPGIKELLNGFMPNFKILMLNYNPLIFIPAIISLITFAVFFFVMIRKTSIWRLTTDVLRNFWLLTSLIALYLLFLIYISTTYAMDAIDDRFLSPIYAPLTILIFVFIHALVEPYKKSHSVKKVNLALNIGVSIWLILLIAKTISVADYINKAVQVSGAKSFEENETVKYITKELTLNQYSDFYTNNTAVNPVLNLWFAGIGRDISSNETRINIKDISKINEYQHKPGKILLVWFDVPDKYFLFTLDSLRIFANVQPVERLRDGTIYAIKLK